MAAASAFPALSAAARRKSPTGLNTRCGPAAMQGRTFSFLSPGYSVFVPHCKDPQEKICPPKNLGDNWGTNMKTLK